MTRLFQFAGVAFVLLGLAYLALPRRIYHFSPVSLSETQSGSSEPSTLILWTYRFIGGCLVVVGVSYLF
ncbi:hypothetical protein C2R22_14305 [Salinigranum rubrum]|uniref:DUF6199 domain-containing protein n=1 Tax=Salinigranum rubrum TaxID=755307 RepID=A0A2I8VNJ5_9EURY|nr:hypothetical protein C2R22_14305 [Salinigranum rubrum]